jgi:hypothetical protein
MDRGRSDDERPVRELINAYARSLDALKARGVIRSTKVLADYAEWLAAKALGLVLVEGGAQKGYDAKDPRTGLRYQVKARQVAPPYMQPDLRGQGSLDAAPFDLLVGILVDGNFEVIRAAVVPLPVVQARAKRIAYNNGFRIHMASGLLNLPEVVDVTEGVRRASES